MSQVKDELASEATGHYQGLIRQNNAFCRAVHVALQAGTETAEGMTATVQTGVAKAVRARGLAS
jgi:hypothetical protein